MRTALVQSAAAAALLGAVLAPRSVRAQPPTPRSPVTLDVDWAAFLNRSDLVFNVTPTTLPSDWTQALYGGNGDLGFLLTADAAAPALHVSLSRQSLYDDRQPALGSPLYLNNFVYDQPRLPVGHLVITWSSGRPLVAAAGRVALHDAVATLNVSTGGGGWCAIAAWASAAYDSSGGAGADVVVVETTWGGGDACAASFVPERCVSTWKGRDERYVPNPPPLNATRVLSPELTLALTSQPHLPQSGTWHSSALLRAAGGPRSATYFFTVSPVLASQAAADAWATAEVTAAAALGRALRELHEAWWHAWWPAGGFLSFEYSVLESFWWSQLYKFASGARRGRTVHDLEGPWFIAGTDWPDLHWDMNLQQTYYLPLAANRPDLSATLVDYVAALHASGALDGNVPAAWRADSAAAPTGASSLSGVETCYWNYGANCTTAPPSVTGNLLWTLSLVHAAASYAGDAAIDTRVVFPLLDRALQFYQHFQVARPDGSVHLPPTFSPEYPGPAGPDANYDVALYRWGLQLAVALCAEHNLTSPHLPAWIDTLAHLTPYSVDAATDTFEIYAGTPYGTPHRHYSHLFMIWPLSLLDFTNASQFATARNSINLWLATPEEDSMFYRPAASAMNVLLKQHAAAFDNVTYLLHHRIEGSGWYREGATGSCTETPYAAAWAVADWLLQSWNTTRAGGGGAPAHVLDFFPGVQDVVPLAEGPYAAAPAKVATARFFRLGAEGGALGSGARELVSSNATHYVTRTAFVAVEAGAGGSGSIVLRTNMARPLAVSPPGVPFTELGDGGLVRVDVGAGGGAALYSAAAPPASFAVGPAGGCAAEFNFWGWPRKAGGGGGGGGPGGAPVVLRACAVGADGRVAPAQRFAWNATAGTFALLDGSGRCLSIATCDGGNGDRVTVAPCAAGAPPPPPPTGVGCDGSGSAACAAQAQAWRVTGAGARPPNAIISALGGRCIDVNGATNAGDIDVWDCALNGNEFSNEGFVFNATSGGIVTLDSDPACGCLGFCLTPS